MAASATLSRVKLLVRTYICIRGKCSAMEKLIWVWQPVLVVALSTRWGFSRLRYLITIMGITWLVTTRFSIHNNHRVLWPNIESWAKMTSLTNSIEIYKIIRLKLKKQSHMRQSTTSRIQAATKPFRLLKINKIILLNPLSQTSSLTSAASRSFRNTSLFNSTNNRKR